MMEHQKKIRKRRRLVAAFYIAMVTACVMWNRCFFCVAQVYGSSMEPSLAHGDIVLVSRWKYTPAVGDIILSNKENPLQTPLVKRIVALQGQHIYSSSESIIVDGVMFPHTNMLHLEGIHDTPEEVDMMVPTGYIFLVGDNTNSSKDSRHIGCLPLESIEGKVVFIIFPFNRWTPL